MKRPNYLIICISIILAFSSCSSDEEINPDDQLIGTWQGGLTQPDFGVLTTTLTITSLEAPGSSGSGSFSTTDLSNCDNVQFFCEPLMCSFNLSFLSSTGSRFELDQMLIGTSTCGDGIFEVTLVNDNAIDVIWYEEAFPDNRATGRLSK